MKIYKLGKSQQQRVSITLTIQLILLGAISLDYCTFHECANFTDWEERTLQFNSPDGQFVLFHFNIQELQTVPFQIYTLVEEGPSGLLELVIKVCGTSK